MNDNLSGWNEWSEAFDDWTDVSISELHGLMTGVMTACHPPTEGKDWARFLEELSFSEPAEQALTLLTEEAEDVAFALKDKDDAYGFMPLVPDDEHDLYERMLALKHWASGFLTGIGVADMSLTDAEQESLVDLAKIASIRLEPDTEFDEEGGEESYFQLFDFPSMMPFSLSTRQRKDLLELPLIAGLPLHAKTAQEVQAQSETPSIPPVVDAMNYQRPS